MSPSAGDLVAGIKFEKYDIIAGCAFGVYKTESEEEIAKLEALIENNSLHSITESEYNNCLKKKRPSYIDSNRLKEDSGIPIKGQSAAIVVKGNPEEADVSINVKAVTTADEALVLSKVTAPQEQAAKPQAITAPPAVATETVSDQKQATNQTSRAKK